MSKGTKIIDGLTEAVAYARGEAGASVVRNIQIPQSNVRHKGLSLSRITKRDLDRLEKAMGRLLSAEAASTRCAARQGIVTMGIADRVEKAQFSLNEILNALRAKAAD